MGDYDLPALIDYSRKVTGQNKVAYISHSLGTTEMFYAISNK